MKDFIHKRLKETLNELFLTQKFKTISYPNRVNDSWIGKPLKPTDVNFDKIPLPQEAKNEIKNRVLNLEKITFSVTNAGLGILIYSSKDVVYYDNYPQEQRDKGIDLYTIIRNNEANTIYWKPSGMRPADIQTFIKYDDLINYMNGKNIGTETKPITLNTILTIRNLMKNKK